MVYAERKYSFLTYHQLLHTTMTTESYFERDNTDTFQYNLKSLIVGHTIVHQVDLIHFFSDKYIERVPL